MKLGVLYGSRTPTRRGRRREREATYCNSKELSGILAFRGGPFGDHRYLIQAKRWSNKVGIEPVRQLLFLQGHYRATKGCLATTSTFTRGARELAAEYRWQLDLKDLRGIQAWVAEAIRG